MGRPDNQSIQCSVKACKFNDKVKFCTLDAIQVGTYHSNNDARSKNETDCMSFEPDMQ